MFTGLIEEIGKVVTAHRSDHGRQLQIAAPQIAEQAKTGDSVAVNGCCLTVTCREGELLTFDLLEETITRTNLNTLPQGSPVNLERALRADSSLGGHFVQGHVDCVSSVIAFDRKGADFRLELELPAEFAHYVVSKGSVAVNGTSLTVGEVLQKSFVTWIIPFTHRHTNLGSARAGNLVNIEFDILAKYVERMVAPLGPAK